MNQSKKNLLEKIEYEIYITDNKIFDEDRKNKIEKLLKLINQNFNLANIYDYEDYASNNKQFLHYKWINEETKLSINQYLLITKGSLKNNRYNDLAILTKSIYLTDKEYPIMDIQLYRLDGEIEFYRINYKHKRSEDKILKKIKTLS